MWLEKSSKEVVSLTPEEKALKKKKSLFNNFIKNTLRRASYRWSPRGEAEKAARIARGLYRCAICQGEFKRGEVELDHVEPVVPIKESWMDEEGNPDWNLYIRRLFCEKEGYQIICKRDHEVKTEHEDTMRAFFNEKRKSLDKKKKEE